MKPFKRDYTVDYDLEDPELNERWDELVEDLHSKCPVQHSNVGETYWVISKHEDVKRCAIDWQTFSNSEGFMVNRPEGLPYFAPGEWDPPVQTGLRAALAVFLTPKTVKRFEEPIRRHADRLIDRFIEKGEVEFVSAFANPLPQTVFSVEIAGMDVEDMPYLLDAFNLSGPMEERGAGFARGMAKVAEYLERRESEPSRGDIVDALLAFEHEGYTRADKIGTMSQLIIGGIGTTGYAFSGGLHHLATHPQDRDALKAEPSEIPRAIEEFLRMFLGAPNMGRRVMRDTEVAGQPIEQGARVLLSFGAANRDPAVWERPNDVDITRPPGGHLAFGAGVHRCIGAPLALAILRIGFERLLERMPDLRVPDDFAPQYETGNVRHMVSLPLRFTPGPVIATQDTAADVSAEAQR